MAVQQCPVCSSKTLVPFLRRNNVSVHQNLVTLDQDSARSVAMGELDFVACNDCGFVFNRAFDLSLLSYSQDYDNTQSCSAYFDSYLDGIVMDLVERKGLRNCTIVEVGCGKGHFLRKLLNYPNSNNRGFGFDPSYVGPEFELDGRLSFRRCYYDATCADVIADVVICRHVIEHVPEPMPLLHSIRSALSQSPNARVFFETPCVEWTLRNQVIWDFFYEHCSLFTAGSLSLAFEGAGFSVNHIEHVFGGQYLWLEAQKSTIPAPPCPRSQSTAELAQAYGAAEQALREKWHRHVETLKSQGKVALWGAGAKGATLANLIDEDGGLIDCIVDVNPNKQQCFIPGTGHPIVSPSEAEMRGVKFAVLMNPNYREEILQTLTAENMAIELVDWSEL